MYAAKVPDEAVRLDVLSLPDKVGRSVQKDKELRAIRNYRSNSEIIPKRGAGLVH